MCAWKPAGRKPGRSSSGDFGILEDTLLGRWLPAWRKRRKRRLSVAAKFYFSDVGVVNRLARRGEIVRGSQLYGKAFENWVHHELAAYVAYTAFDGELAHWRLPSGVEVDFVLGEMRLAVEAKATAAEALGRGPRAERVAAGRRGAHGAVQLLTGSGCERADRP